jgi:hypothetical protein
MNDIGHRRWAIAEGYIPGWSSGPEPEMKSHETCCVLNASEREARVRITIFFADREPAGPYLVTVPPRRTKHVRLTSWRTRSRFRRRRRMRASSNRTCRSWYSTPGSIRASLRMR